MNDEQHDNEPAQLQAWSELRAAAIEDVKDKRIAELERIVDQQRGQFEALRGSFVTVTKRLHARIKVLEDALTPFADACNDPDIASGQSNHTLYTLEWSEVGRRHVAIITSLGNLLDIGHLRAAYEAHGKPAPYLVDGGVWSDAPAGSGRGAYLPDPTISSGLRCPCHLEKTDAQDTPPEPE